MAGHYERQRRLQTLDTARTLIVSPPNKHDVLTVEVELQAESRQATVVPVQADDNPPAGDEDAWGFENQKKTQKLKLKSKDWNPMEMAGSSMTKLMWSQMKESRKMVTKRMIRRRLGLER